MFLAGKSEGIMALGRTLRRWREDGSWRDRMGDMDWIDLALDGNK
jgi:hypothetical protein